MTPKVLSLWTLQQQQYTALSPVANSGCFPRGKRTATEECYLVYSSVPCGKLRLLSTRQVSNHRTVLPSHENERDEIVKTLELGSNGCGLTGVVTSSHISVVTSPSLLPLPLFSQLLLLCLVLSPPLFNHSAPLCSHILSLSAVTSPLFSAITSFPSL